MAYISTPELVDYLRSSIIADDAEIEASRLAAETVVNGYCQRTFDVPTVATLRTFVVTDYDVVIVHDIANTTDLVIIDNGSTVSASAYQLEIAPGVPGPIGVDGRTWPYVILRRTSGSWYVDHEGEATLSVTARWGWSALPPEVPLATKMLAKDLLLARDTPFGFVQVGDFSRRIAANPVAESLLAPLKRVEAWGFA